MYGCMCIYIYVCVEEFQSNMQIIYKFIHILYEYTLYLRCRGLVCPAFGLCLADILPFGELFGDFFDFGDCSIETREKTTKIEKY